MVGTAVYQVGLASLTQPKNLSVLKLGAQNTEPPARSGASTPAIRPWMWKSGMTTRPRSTSVKARVRLTLRALAQTLAWVSGTILGREVEPEVWSTRATSDGAAGPPDAGTRPGTAPVSSRKRPAPFSGVVSS